MIRGMVDTAVATVVDTVATTTTATEAMDFNPRRLTDRPGFSSQTSCQRGFRQSNADQQRLLVGITAHETAVKFIRRGRIPLAEDVLAEG